MRPSTDHLRPERLGAASLTEAEQAHLATCVRCRGEHRLSLDDEPRAADPPGGASPPIPYTLGRRIGSGGMGVVYEARHAALGTRHAIKLLRVPDPILRARLMREGRLQARLFHRNVVPIEDVVEIDGAPALVMPFVEGPTLSRVLAGEVLPTDVALELFRAIATGVAEIHRARLVHRDLKPANVLLEVLPTEVIPRVADFGLAKGLATLDGTVQTRTGAMLGTPAYAAPEQLLDAAVVGPAADVFSLGCLLYELLTGRRAFAGVDRDPQPVLDGIPAELAALIRRCLAPAPADRPPDALALLETLPPAAPVDLRRWCATGAEAEAGWTIPLRSGLPREPDPFVGRASELGALDDRVADGQRNVAVVGPAGVGKTRLLLRYGATREVRYPGGALWVDAALEDPARAVARTLDLALDPADDAVERVGAALLARGPTLLLLDDGAAPGPLVARWVDQAPGLVVVWSARASVEVEAEGSLAVGALAPEDAAALFVARATAGSPGGRPTGGEAAGIVALVDRVGRIPLAIELLAARARSEPLADVLAWADDRLGPGPVTLGALIAAEWDRLPPATRQACVQLLVFAGSFTLEAAESVVDLSDLPDAPWTTDLVQELCDAALLRSDSLDSAVRMRLHRAVREHLSEGANPAEGAPPPIPRRGAPGPP